ncbi:hypothetical protein QQ045_013466 [Rhodiola kirilowii]
MMIKLGFAEAWVRKIMMCISRVTYKVKINDNISESIEPERGLRQGDPISPYLFLICAEWLTHAIDKAQRLGYIEGISICKNAPVVTHLMFADDCLIFLKAKTEAVVHVRKLLNDYELLAGQKVNFNKSEMVCSKNVSELLISEMAEALQVKIVESHTKYLGLPIIFGHKKKHLFREIEEKISRKLGDWKSKILPGAGREVLIKAMLQSIPLYAMSCFKIPVTLCKKLVAYLLGF